MEDTGGRKKRQISPADAYVGVQLVVVVEADVAGLVKHRPVRVTFLAVEGEIIKTSQLGRLQAQTLPDATPPPSSKITITFEPVMQF